MLSDLCQDWNSVSVMMMGGVMPEFLFIGIVDCHFLVFGGNQNWWWWRFIIFLKIAGYQR